MMRVKMSKPPPTRTTASAIVGRPGTGSLPSTIAPPDHHLFRMNARKRPIEIAEDIVGADNWFSVVISYLDDKVQVQDRQSKIYKECDGEEEGF